MAGGRVSPRRLGLFGRAVQEERSPNPGGGLQEKPAALPTSPPKPVRCSAQEQSKEDAPQGPMRRQQCADARHVAESGAKSPSGPSPSIPLGSLSPPPFLLSPPPHIPHCLHPFPATSLPSTEHPFIPSATEEGQPRAWQAQCPGSAPPHPWPWDVLFGGSPISHGSMETGADWAGHALRALGRAQERASAWIRGAGKGKERKGSPLQGKACEALELGGEAMGGESETYNMIQRL